MAKKYCYLQPDFPKKAFVVIPLILRDLINVDFIPLHQIVETVDDAVEYVRNFASEFEKGDQLSSIEVMDSCVIIPITFEKLYPLRAEFWKNPHVSYSILQRDSLFLKFIKNPTMHKLLVNPSFYNSKTKTWILEPTLPLNLKVSKKVLENFMLTSDAIVDERASHCAIYNVGDVMRLNRKTKKIDLIISENLKSEIRN